MYEKLASKFLETHKTNTTATDAILAFAAWLDQQDSSRSTQESTKKKSKPTLFGENHTNNSSVERPEIF